MSHAEETMRRLLVEPYFTWSDSQVQHTYDGHDGPILAIDPTWADWAGGRIANAFQTACRPPGASGRMVVAIYPESIVLVMPEGQR